MKKAIVIIDDESIVLYSLKNELVRIFGDEVKLEFCESGEEGLKVIDFLLEQSYHIPVVVSDYIMPGMKGDVFLQNVYEKLPNTKTILLTGLASVDGITHAVNHANLYRYISKPWEINDFEMTIREAYNSYLKQLELDEHKEKLQIANNRLKALDETKDSLLNVISHEFFTPLTSIFGFASIIKTLNVTPELNHYSDMITRSAERIKNLSEKTLLITKIKLNKYNFFFKLFSLIKVTNKTIEYFRNQINDKKINLIINFPEEDIQINADEELIAKVISILIENAVKHSESESNIVMNLNQNESGIIMEINDEGPGFSEEYMWNKFDFFIIEKINNHNIGLGIDLAAAKLIMDVHNFRIELTSKENEGAIFRLFF